MKIWTYSAIAPHHFLNNPEVQKRRQKFQYPDGTTTELVDTHYSFDDFSKLFFVPKQCPYCKASCKTLGTCDNSRTEGLDYSNVIAELIVCPQCGWWTIPVVTMGEEIEIESMWATVGQVRGKLALFTTDGLGLPLQELRRFLLAKYDSKLYVNPQRIEEVVGDIFRSIGFYVTLTPRTGDHGIDLFVLARQDGTRIGVQVKRTKNKIEAELIRSFAGALLLEGITGGIFVTTSDYTLGARATAAKYATERGYRIELLEANKFYEALGLHLRPAYSDGQDSSAPFYSLWRDPRSIPSTRVGSMFRIQV